jgi:hypothetical protein
MAKAVVVNLTDKTVTLQTHDGDSVSVPPTTPGRSARIDAKFMEWITPHPNQIKVLYYIDNQGQRVNELPQPAEPDEANKSAEPATSAAVVSRPNPPVTIERTVEVKQDRRAESPPIIR